MGGATPRQRQSRLFAIHVRVDRLSKGRDGDARFASRNAGGYGPGVSASGRQRYRQLAAAVSRPWLVLWRAAAGLFRLFCGIVATGELPAAAAALAEGRFRLPRHPLRSSELCIRGLFAPRLRRGQGGPRPVKLAGFAQRGRTCSRNDNSSFRRNLRSLRAAAARRVAGIWPGRGEPEGELGRQWQAPPNAPRRCSRAVRAPRGRSTRRRILRVRNCAAAGKAISAAGSPSSIPIRTVAVQATKSARSGCRAVPSPPVIFNVPRRPR